MEVAERAEELAGRIACVTFAEPRMLRGFERRMQLPYPIYGDPDRETYRAFGFGRASARRVWLDPRVAARYARLLARGRRPDAEAPKQDTLQLGGDAVIDARSHLSWIYRSSGPEDRPPVDRLVAAMHAA
ncbi:MAG: hypothetical protein AVDCRST_MAG17-1819 [uncultured Solirubrobacterales bacterium]|uniref:Redoxin domain-containing protein n=1 Tax=uncultured Solirubrobacterales bacterium TaxID=768556 RepID=A0A6J4SXL5_9ACTN|nr:MAG: hypothetical protein AVDCRST_MAG17-1819 [uncultured Solirubrobacterales bacterium]